MDFHIITPPAEEPVSLETAKAFLRVDHSTDDALITTLLKSAREQGEGIARQAFVTQTIELILDEWPVDRTITLPRPPLQSVDAITYLDSEGEEHAWTDFTTDTRSEPGVVIFNSLPSDALQESGAIAVEFTAGYGDAAAVPEVFKTAILLSVGHWYEHREMAGELPAEARRIFMQERGSWF